MATMSTLGLTEGNWKLRSSPPSAETTAKTTERSDTAVGLAETMPAGGERSAADGDREDRHGE